MAGRTNVWDRLYDPATYTGVYAERFRDGPGINQDARDRPGGDFHGHTNAGTDQVIRDIASITRPHLNRRGRTESPRERRLSGLRDEEASRGLAAEPAYPLDANTQLQLIFQYYCRFGRTGPRGTAQDTIDSFNFMRLARECPDLLDSRLDRAEVDLIFAKCRSKGQRRLEYRQFLDALAAMAITKYPAEDPVAAFSLLLGHHVFKCAAAEGLREARAIKAREQAEAEDAAWGSADYDSHERAAHDLAGRAGGGGGREGGYGGDGRGRARRASVDDPEAPLERDAVFRGRVRQERRTSTLGSDRFKPTMAGEANRPGGVYDRLSQPSGFTGVYRRAFFTDGRMNASADTGVSSIPTRFRGSTNAGSNETIHSISVALRPGLRSGKSFR
ncbi:hypothetical protein FNF27_07285 [Cafeteria roenbergensis]|uniref:EF-hand domain-containing protein n=2 Tax=Cafeteria roenbergensis TaxID=33653 RepID=A0A5A8CQH9_CAFRO|nr:hypothetical protein FNF29_02338 [Cafeteria roenbergensis]KAA0167619.1 hypothetical protein FNF27_07285 [Cafeteria roenbergensis]|eukprot:KAA0154460.1 hypothetical protein FNF29_02338 [Cafeteria roenbergensis]